MLNIWNCNSNYSVNPDHQVLTSLMMRDSQREGKKDVDLQAAEETLPAAVKEKKNLEKTLTGIQLHKRERNLKFSFFKLMITFFLVSDTHLKLLYSRHIFSEEKNR